LGSGSVRFLAKPGFGLFLQCSGFFFYLYTVKLKRSFFNLRTDVLVALRYSAELWSSDSGFESQQVCL